MIKFVSRSDFNKARQKQIMDCMRAFQIDHGHVTGLKRAFMDCDMDEKGEICLKEFLEKIREMEQKYTPQALNFFLNLMKINEVFDNRTTRVVNTCNPEHRPDDRLSIYRLYSLEQILYKTSTFPERNCSKAFKNTIQDHAYDDVDDYKGKDIQHQADKTEKEKRRIRELFRRVHLRIEEKFGEYRKAFRQFDINKDNDLSFEEFVSGCEFCGIALSIRDFKAVYDTIDYDNNGGINFDKFCLLNADRTKDVLGFIDQEYINR